MMPDEYPGQASCPTSVAQTPPFCLSYIPNNNNIDLVEDPGPIHADTVSNLELEAIVGPFDALLDGSEEVFQETLRYFEYLETSSPTLFGIISDAAQELTIGADAQYMSYPSSLANSESAEALTSSSVTQDSQDLEVFVNGRVMYKCGQCGKLHDRKGRLIACTNSHSGRKPFHCLGSCGRRTCKKTYASEELLNRHCVPSSDRRRECIRCSTKVLKQNLSRHKKSCSPASQT